jgi:hypothetical protein
MDNKKIKRNPRSFTRYKKTTYIPDSTLPYVGENN